MQFFCSIRHSMEPLLDLQTSLLLHASSELCCTLALSPISTSIRFRVTFRRNSIDQLRTRKMHGRMTELSTLVRSTLTVTALSLTLEDGLNLMHGDTVLDRELHIRSENAARHDAISPLPVLKSSNTRLVSSRDKSPLNHSLTTFSLTCPLPLRNALPNCRRLWLHQFDIDSGCLTTLPLGSR